MSYQNLGNTCFINCILYTFHYSSALNSLLTLREKEIVQNKKDSFVSILLNSIQDEKRLPVLVQYLERYFPSYSRGAQFDAHEFLLFILEHLKSDWYIVNTESEKICESCQLVETDSINSNWTLLYNTETSFSDALMSLNREILELNCNECGSTTRHLRNIKLTPPLLWCFQFPQVKKKTANVLLPTEFQYHTESERYTYCLVSAVVHITLKKEVGHYVTFIHNDKRVYKAKIKKSKSFESLKSARTSLDSIRDSLSNVDISCTFSNKAKFLKCNDDEISDLSGTELYKHLALPHHHLYLVWYQMIDKASVI